jgi:DNA repair exonuclease SbcCD ATPase subunit
MSTLDERISSRQRQADEDEARARDLDIEAETLGRTLLPEWSELLADEALYQAEAHAIEGLKPLANKAPELLLARGRLEMVQLNETQVMQALEDIPLEHRLQLATAEQAEKDARRRLREVQDEQVTLGHNHADLVERRKRGAEYTVQAAQAAEAAEVWDLLADLLKKGGGLQVWIANRELKQIVHEVNLVLQKLDDPLRVQVGDPQRKNKAEAQEVVVLDLMDPLQEAKHYNLLSGGEQFRVALALALALHRRVIGGAVGTLIVDEGFGALDSDRRDTLAQQMADASGGLLRLGLAHSVLICSHSNEVQRHFPERWIVSKQAGTAKVCRFKNDGDTDSSQDCGDRE